VPTPKQLEALYILAFDLTVNMNQPIHLVSMMAGGSLYLLGGRDEGIEFLIAPDGRIRE
jgi:hypothetical protein